MVNGVFCVLHGGTRVMEKLLNLELETIGSEKHKIHMTKCGLDGTDVLHNLEANINLRGVRSGTYKIHINPNSGNPEPVSLNKNAAFVIISPPLPGMEEKFPHPLHNIIGVWIVKIPFRDCLRKFLELPKEMPELQLVMSIWEIVITCSKHLNLTWTFQIDWLFVRFISVPVLMGILSRTKAPLQISCWTLLSIVLSALYSSPSNSIQDEINWLCPLFHGKPPCSAAPLSSRRVRTYELRP